MPPWRSDLRRTLMQDEGYRERPYPDSGGLAQGYGSQLVGGSDASKLMRDPSLPEPSERERHLSLFLADEATALDDARTVIPEWDGLPDPVKIATASMAYQMGRGGLTEFVRMREAIARQDWDGVAREMLDSKWAREDTPERAQAFGGPSRGDPPAGGCRIAHPERTAGPRPGGDRGVRGCDAGGGTALLRARCWTSHSIRRPCPSGLPSMSGRTPGWHARRNGLRAAGSGWASPSTR